MDEKQIRVGNLFERIDTMSNETLGVAEFTAHTWYRIGECIDNLEWYTPIPLTKEWFLKFGFKKEGNTAKYWTLGTVDLWEISGTYVNDLDYEVKYVHQLQNLYFALTGEELIIK